MAEFAQDYPELILDLFDKSSELVNKSSIHQASPLQCHLELHCS